MNIWNITTLYLDIQKEYAKIYFKGEPISDPTYFVDLYEIVNTALINLGDKIDSSYDLTTNKDLNYFFGFILTVLGTCQYCTFGCCPYFQLV